MTSANFNSPLPSPKVMTSAKSNGLTKSSETTTPKEHNDVFPHGNKNGSSVDNGGAELFVAFLLAF